MADDAWGVRLALRTVARYVDLSSIHLAPRGDLACDTADIHRVPEKNTRTSRSSRIPSALACPSTFNNLFFFSSLESSTKCGDDFERLLLQTYLYSATAAAVVSVDL